MITSLISSTVRTKLLALYLGPVGLGVIGQLNNFSSLLVSTLSLGTPLGLTTKLSNINNSSSEEKSSLTYQYLKHFILVFFFVGSLAVTAITIFKKEVTQILLGDGIYEYLLVIFIISVPFSISYSFIESLLKSTQRINIIVNISIISSIVSLILLFPLLNFFSLEGSGIYYVILSSSPVFIFIIFFRNIISKLRSNSKEDVKYSEIYKLGTVSLIASFMQMGAQIVLRILVINKLGLESNGFLQALLSVSSNAFTLIYMFLSNYTLPKFSSITDDTKLISELNTNFRFLLLIVVPLISILIIFKNSIVSILFSESFASIENLIPIQVFGDFYRTGAALFGLWLIPRYKIKQLISIDLVFNVTYLALPFIFLNFIKNDLIYLSIAYLLSFFLHFLLYYIYSRINLGFKLEKSTKRIYIISNITVIMMCICSFMFVNNSIWNIIIFLIWVGLILSGQDRHLLISKLRNIFLKE